MLRPWPLNQSKTLADYKFFRIDSDRAVSPRTGEAQDFFILHMPDWLLVVAQTVQGELLLVRQYRHGSRRFSTEIPGGLIDAGETNPAVAARRELLEETGYGNGTLHALGTLWPQPALMANRVHCFYIEGVELIAEPNLDAGEDIETHTLPPDVAREAILNGELDNAVTISALAMAQARGFISGLF
jgi:8-oxo-dGTP pyrophosphatase MutT (NUDIX family)